MRNFNLEIHTTFCITNRRKKFLMSAIANAEHNFDLDVENLYVSEAYVNEGPTMETFPSDVLKVQLHKS